MRARPKPSPRLPTCFPSARLSATLGRSAFDVLTVPAAVRAAPVGSALRRVSPPVSLFTRASLSPRLVAPTTMASADFCPTLPGLAASGATAERGRRVWQISPGKDTLLRRTAAVFTSARIPVDFAVLCQLIAARRPSMRFLSIGSRLSPSLTSHARSPSRSWLQMVVSSFPCSGVPTGDLNPIYNVPMLGTHKCMQPTSHLRRAQMLQHNPNPCPASSVRSRSAVPHAGRSANN